MHFIRAHSAALGISIGAGLLYLLFMLFQHAHFGTSGWDLGIFMQALFQYAHGSIGPNTVRNVPTLLADHLEPIMFLISPLWWIFRDKTLFIAQSIAVILGGLGVYTAVLTRDHPWKKVYALAALCIFCLHWSLVQAIFFDYHNNVVGMMLLPWIIVSVQYKKWLYAWLLVFLFLMTKETSALLVVMLGLGLIFSKEKSARVHGIGLSLIGLLYFLLAVKILIPLAGSGKYAHLTYDRLGSSLGEMLLFILQHPIQTLFMFFDAPEKLQFWKYTFASGGFLLLLWPRLLALALPLIAMKMLSSKENHWGVWFHYQVELSVLISIAIGWSCMRISKRTASLCVIFLLCINILISARMPLADRVTPVYRHVMQTFSVLSPWQIAAREALLMIPESAAVSANNVLIPHLAQRMQIFLFPDVDQAEYVLIHSDTYNVWPLATREDMQKALDVLANDSRFEQIYSKENVILYKKIS